MSSTHYIFRWKDSGICVTPSRSRTPEEVWKFAIEALRPAGMHNDTLAERWVRQRGEVIKDDE